MVTYKSNSDTWYAKNSTALLSQLLMQSSHLKTIVTYGDNVEVDITNLFKRYNRIAIINITRYSKHEYKGFVQTIWKS